MAAVGDDCYFFYQSSCMKGQSCPYRHVEDARHSQVTCEDWMLKVCQKPNCPFRHSQLQTNRQATPCYFETQPGGCTKSHCLFLHQFGKTTSSVSTIQPPTTSVMVHPSVIQQQPPVTGAVHPIVWAPPMSMATNSAQGMWAGGPMRPHVFPPHHPLGFMPFMTRGPPPPLVIPPFNLKPASDNIMHPIEPIIINPNEESDPDSIRGSPLKPTRRVVPTTQAQSSNPLDYFLNAKPWVDPSLRKPVTRSPSPVKACRSGTSSPVQRSPSYSPGPGTSNRRSLSVDRFESGGVRRRSGSLGRSRSPDWRDRRQFGRRSRTPPSKRRDPIRSRNKECSRDTLSRFKSGDKTSQLEEIKITGSKIISIKKDKKDEECDKKEEKVEEIPKDKEPEKPSAVVNEPVKSLEEIYRERALLSLMEAKRKKILENKRKRWENVKEQKNTESDVPASKTSEADIPASKKSESDVSEKISESENSEKTVDEKGDNHDEEEEASNDSLSEKEAFDISLADDIDIELDVGEKEQSDEKEFSEETDSEEDASEVQDSLLSGADKDVSSLVKSRTTSSIVVPVKPSIKSRLGLKIEEQNSQRSHDSRIRNSPSRVRSVKDRLGLRPDLSKNVDKKPVRSGVIKLRKSASIKDSILSRNHINRGIERAPEESKNVLMLPKVTIPNNLDRKADIKQRLGRLLDEDSSSNSRRDRKKKKDIDEELMKIVREENADVSEDDLELLTKREKKKLLKKLLLQQGREDEYENFRRKKRGTRKKKERLDDEYVQMLKRRINPQSPVHAKARDAEDSESECSYTRETDVGEDIIALPDEIQLEGVQETEENLPSEDMQLKVKNEIITKPISPGKSMEDIRLAKIAKLKEALEPKSLEDIRKERSLKRTQGGTANEIKIAVGQNKRTILLDDKFQQSSAPEPPFRVTFGSRDVPRRKLLRLGETAEQNENNQPISAKTEKTFKQERQIYIPPSLKRTEGPASTDARKAPEHSYKDREIINYGDMFQKKSASAGDLMHVKRLPDSTGSSSSSNVLAQRPPLRLEKGPVKVEIKNATVKTFAEIMAEKKRKRLEAMQENKKPNTDITSLESGSSSSLPTSKPTESVFDRLSPVSLLTSSIESPSKSIHSKDTLISSTLILDTHKSVISNNVNNVQKEIKSRGWKRRNKAAISSPSVLLENENSNSLEAPSLVNSAMEKTVQNVSVKSAEKLNDIDDKSASTAPMDVEQTEAEVREPPEKKMKSSDIFTDFDDDLLDIDIDEVDIELNNKDHDELIREIDELLS